MWPWLGPVSTYAVFYFAGILSHFLISCSIAKRLGLRRRVWIVVSICYMVSMTAAARLLYDIQQGQFDFRAMLTIRHYMEGGLWGGLLAYIGLAVPLGFILAKRKQEALDLVAMSIPIPLIFAKLGCLFNGCCYGKKCSMPWAITFPQGSKLAPPNIPLHPTQIYEILVLICIFVVFRMMKYERWRGKMLLWFLTLYGLGRAVIEFWRGDFDQHLYVYGFTLTQLICLAAVSISIVLLCFAPRSK
jgi:phosphatidylglycerol:prolipoprotein diacylglycerol transferase